MHDKPRLDSKMQKSENLAEKSRLHPTMNNFQSKEELRAPQLTVPGIDSVKDEDMDWVLNQRDDKLRSN